MLKLVDKLEQRCLQSCYATENYTNQFNSIDFYLSMHRKQVFTAPLWHSYISSIFIDGLKFCLKKFQARGIQYQPTNCAEMFHQNRQHHGAQAPGQTAPWSLGSGSRLHNTMQHRLQVIQHKAKALNFTVQILQLHSTEPRIQATQHRAKVLMQRCLQPCSFNILWY